MRLLLIDRSGSAGDQRALSVFPSDVLQPFLCRCSRQRDFGVVAHRFFVDVGIDGLRWLSIATIENGCRRRNRDPLVSRSQASRQHLHADGTEAVWVPLLIPFDGGAGGVWDPISMLFINALVSGVDCQRPIPPSWQLDGEPRRSNELRHPR